MAYEPSNYEITRARRGGETREQTRARLIQEHDMQETRRSTLSSSLETDMARWQREDEAARQQRQQRQQQEADAALKETARRAFLANPAATQSDFEQAWPGLRTAYLQQQALGGLAGANPSAVQAAVNQHFEVRYREDLGQQ